MTEAQTKESFGSDVQLADFTGVQTTKDADDNVVSIKVNFSQATAIEANHPYLIKVSDDITGFTVENVTVSPEETPSVDRNEKTTEGNTSFNRFLGTYVAGTTLPNHSMFLSGNKFYYSDGTATMKAYRAYFDFYDVLSEVESGGNVRMNILLDGEETHISELPFVTKEESSIYDLTGRKINKVTRVFYIINGKKTIVK